MQINVLLLWSKYKSNSLGLSSVREVARAVKNKTNQTQLLFVLNSLRLVCFYVTGILK